MSAIVAFYKSICNYDTCDVKAEYDRWTHKWADTAQKDRPSNPASALEHCDSSFFPAISTYLKIFCCIPATTATPERIFSTLKYLKSYLRSTTSDERLNGLTRLYLHRDFGFDSEGVIDRFAAKKRRTNFIIWTWKSTVYRRPIFVIAVKSTIGPICAFLAFLRRKLPGCIYMYMVYNIIHIHVVGLHIDHFWNFYDFYH